MQSDDGDLGGESDRKVRVTHVATVRALASACVCRPLPGFVRGGGARKKRSLRCDQITSCTYPHSRVRVAGGELNPQCAARTAAAQTVARPPPSWGQATTVCLVQERAVTSWSVGCLTWRGTSARREGPQHHRANPTTNSSGTSVSAEVPSTKDIGERIKAHSRRLIRVLQGGGHTYPERSHSSRLA